MGSCMSSLHKDSTSPINLPMQNHSIPPSPVKEKPVCVSQVSHFHSVPSCRSYGSKEEMFYDSQPWLESDCDDDFYSVNGDFTPSRGSTPARSTIGTPLVYSTFSPQVKHAVFEGTGPANSGSTCSETTSAVNTTGIDVAKVVSSNPDSPSTMKRKKLADLFRNEEGLQTEADATPYISGGQKPTPDEDPKLPKEVLLGSSQCCFPRLVMNHSLRDSKAPTRPAVAVDV